MNNELKVGNVESILAALVAMANVRVHSSFGKPTVLVYTDCSEIDALRAKMDEERSKHHNPRVRTQILCSFQAKQYSIGAWQYSLSTNIYGYAVGDSLRSNMGGGTWACTPRGCSLSDAIVWGCEQAKAKNVCFSFSLARLPSHLHGSIQDLALVTG